MKGTPFLLVTGGKGGVGKTTLAANLGVSLARAGLDTLLVDLDFGLANLDVVLGVRPERTVEDFFADECSMEACIHAGPGGVDFVPAGSGSFAMARPDDERASKLQGALETSAHDLVVGDSPAGIGEDVLHFAAAAQRVLVVTTPDPTAVTDAYGVIKALDAYAHERGVEVATPDLFVNLAGDAVQARSIASNLRTVCERFLTRSPRLVGWMPRTRSVLLSVIAQRPFVLTDPRSAASRSVDRLAHRYAALAARAAPRCRVRRPANQPVKQ